MTYIIAEPCIDIKDKSCVDVCPVDCIHEFERLLIIDPEECIDCGACEPECPVEAIFPEDALPDKWEPFVKINYAFPDAGRDQQARRTSTPPSTTSRTRRSRRNSPLHLNELVDERGARSTRADLTITWSKPAVWPRWSPALSVWFVKPTIGTSGQASATSSGSTRAMSQMTRSGGSTLSDVTRRCAGSKPLELAPEEEVDPYQQDRRHGRFVPRRTDAARLSAQTEPSPSARLK